MKKLSTPSKILLIMIKDMGDVILTAPMAEVLKYNFPKAQIDMLASPVCAPVLENNPFIDNIIIYDKEKSFKEILKIRAKKYDWIIDYLSNPRSAMLCALSGAKFKIGLDSNIHKFYAYNICLKRPSNDIYACDFKLDVLKQLGLKWKSEHAPLPKYYFTKEQEQKSLQIYKELNISPGEKVIGFYATPKGDGRKWTIENFRKTAELLHNKYQAKIMILCAPWERDYALKIKRDDPWIYLSPSTKKIEDIYPILKRLDLLISCCGGTKHLAVSLGIPIVALHFINSIFAWTPVFDKNYIALKANIDCAPCNKKNCLKNYPCKNTITPQMVFEAAQKLLK